MARRSKKRQCLPRIGSGVESEAAGDAVLSRALSKNVPSLPTEIVTLIIESFILIWSFTRSANTLLFAETVRFTPRWYLLPLLRVSKLWHAITVKYLYQTIAVGSRAPFHIPAYPNPRWYGRARTPAKQRIRMGHEVTDDLYKTLAMNSSLAAMITELHLGIETGYRKVESSHGTVYHGRMARTTLIDVPYVAPYWSETCIKILQLCPYVEHVDIRGFHILELDTLIEELAKKSLVYFSISGKNLSMQESGEGTFPQLLGLMERWTKLRGIRVEDFLDYKMTEIPVTLDAFQVSGCCPLADLREIIITGAVLRPEMYRALRSICSGGITKLAVSLHGRQAGSMGDASVDALCECVRLWSPSLQYLKVDIVGNDHRDSYQPLSEAMRTLGELRELHFDRMELDLGAISRLPRLQRLAYLLPYSSSKEEAVTLSSQLEHSEMFPSLKFIVVDKLTVGDEFKEICRRRNIQLVSQY